jgi:dipeptidyl aminopeptidase/acylaminoacyl peptidase
VQLHRRLAITTLAVLVGAMVRPASVQTPEAEAGALQLTVLGTYNAGAEFDTGAAEIVAHDAATQTLFVVNGDSKTLDMLNITDPASPTLIEQVDITEYGASLNSVDVYDGVVAVAVEADPKTDNGSIVFFTTDGEFISSVTVGALPDMLTFSPDGRYVLSANEGEPNDDYTVDPEGSVSIVDVSGGFESLTDANVTTVSFTDFNEGGARVAEVTDEIRVFGPNATAAQDFEPEYIAVSPDSTTAYVTLQENNALAIIDIAAGSVTSLVPFGYKDHSVEGNGLDAINDDEAINIVPQPVFGMYQPDGIAAYEANGAVYLVTANEGDTRDYDGYSEETEVAETELDSTAFPNADELKEESNIGGLENVSSSGDTDGDGDFDVIYIPGGRSFSIWDAQGELVFDSGDQLEQITAQRYPENFNASGDDNAIDDRSDNKGPEPEGVTLGEIDGRTVAFIGLERIGGIIIYDVTDPTAPVFVDYVNNRDFSADPTTPEAGDISPEGVHFVTAEDSPTGNPLVITASELSGTTTIWEITTN